MRMPSCHARHGAVLGLVGISLLAGCAAPPSLDELNASYQRALERSAPPRAVAFEPGSDRERAALDRLAAYFADMSLESVAAQTANVYAPDAYLNDTLAAVEGSAAIEGYFARSLESATALRVRFLDTARSGADYYIRWEMLVEASGLNGGKPVVSYGVSQIRFDAEGRVLVHKDFWDAATGLHEQLPVVGSLVRRVRAAVESE